MGKIKGIMIFKNRGLLGVIIGEKNSSENQVKILVEIIKLFENCRVYDFCCGSGGMFVQSAKFIQAHNGKRG